MRCALVLFVVLFGAACTPSPKNVPCSNQADCKSIDERYGYCLQNQCVECLEDQGCGEGAVCKSGLCERKCSDGRQCPNGQTCSGGSCTDKT